MNVGLLKFVSRYKFVTTSDQLVELVALATKKGESLAGTLTIVDCNLLYTGRDSKAVLSFHHLLSMSRKLSMSILLIANVGTRIDGRLERLVSHTTKLLSTEIPYEEEVK